MRVSMQVIATLLAASREVKASFVGEMKNYMTQTYETFLDDVEYVEEELFTNRFGNREQVLYHDPVEGVS